MQQNYSDIVRLALFLLRFHYSYTSAIKNEAPEMYIKYYYENNECAHIQ